MEKWEQKEEVESLLEDVLRELERQEAPPNEWQVFRFRGAIDAARRGLFGMARKCADLVMAENVSPEPFPNPATKPKDLTGVSAEELRKELESLKNSPVQEKAIF